MFLMPIGNSEKDTGDTYINPSLVTSIKVYPDSTIAITTVANTMRFGPYTDSQIDAILSYWGVEE